MQSYLRNTTRFVHTARTIIFSNYGPPKEVLQVATHKLRAPESGEAVLKLIAAPINPSDINQIEGTYASKPQFSKQFGSSDPVAVPGNEGVFEVIELGKSQTDANTTTDESESLNVGDWVIPSTNSFGTWSTKKLVATKDLISLGKPNGLTPVQAATLTVNPTTAYTMLRHFVPLEKGDWFIQNGSNSGVGRMAIQLAHLRGLKSINVVRDRSDIDELKQELHDLGADHVLTEEQIADKSIKTVIKDWTNGSLPKLALNCVGGRSSTNISRQLGNNGVLVTYGGMSKQPVALPTSLYIFKDVTSKGFWVTRWKNENPAEYRKLITHLCGMFRSQEISVSAMNTLEFSSDGAGGDSGAEFLNLVKSAIAKSGKQILIAA